MSSVLVSIKESGRTVVSWEAQVGGRIHFQDCPVVSSCLHIAKLEASFSCWLSTQNSSLRGPL